MTQPKHPGCCLCDQYSFSQPEFLVLLESGVRAWCSFQHRRGISFLALSLIFSLILSSGHCCVSRVPSNISREELRPIPRWKNSLILQLIHDWDRNQKLIFSFNLHPSSAFRLVFLLHRERICSFSCYREQEISVSTDTLLQYHPFKLRMYELIFLIQLCNLCWQVLSPILTPPLKKEDLAKQECSKHSPAVWMDFKEIYCGCR